MQTVSDNFIASLKGSIQPVFMADAWYDGELVARNLQLVSGSVTLDSSRLIEAGALCTFIAEDGTLIPSWWDSPLACWGSQLHIRAGLQNRGGIEWVSLGWFRNDSYNVDSEQWRLYQKTDTGIQDLLAAGLYPSLDTLPDFALYPGVGVLGNAVGDPIWVCTGSQVSVGGSDLMSLIDDDPFAAPQAPSQLVSVVAEIRFLANGYVSIEDMSGVADGPIPRTFTYDTSRSQTIANLAKLIGCAARMSPDGGLELVSLTQGDPVWTVSVNPNMSPMFGWTRAGDRTGMYNGAIGVGSSLDGTPLQGSAQLTAGPLRWGGPFGRVPFIYQKASLATPTAASADAGVTLAEQSSTRTAVIPVTCPPNFALRTRDVIGLEFPDRTINGTVQVIPFTIGASAMTIQVAVDRDELWARR